MRLITGYVTIQQIGSSTFYCTKICTFIVYLNRHKCVEGQGATLNRVLPY